MILMWKQSWSLWRCELLTLMANDSSACFLTLVCPSLPQNSVFPGGVVTGVVTVWVKRLLPILAVKKPKAMGIDPWEINGPHFPWAERTLLTLGGPCGTDQCRFTSGGVRYYPWRVLAEISFNSLRLSDAYMHHYNIPTFVQITACRLFGAKPLSEPMLSYCQLDLKEHI